MSKLFVTPQDARSYNASLDEWLPEGLHTGCFLGLRLAVAHRAYRLHRDMADWREFVELRKQFIKENER